MTAPFTTGGPTGVNIWMNPGSTTQGLRFHFTPSAGGFYSESLVEDKAEETEAPGAETIKNAHNSGRASLYDVIVIGTGNISNSLNLESAAPTLAAVSQREFKIANVQFQVGVRLADLARMYLEDYERPLQENGVEDFFRFSALYPHLPMPEITAGDAGQLVSVWRHGRSFMSLKFIGNARFHYAFAHKKENKTVRPWGTTTLFEFYKRYPTEQHIELDENGAEGREAPT